MRRPSPTLLDRLTQRANALDRALGSALTCAELDEIAKLPTGPIKNVRMHLRDLSVHVEALRNDLSTLTALTRAGRVKS